MTRAKRMAWTWFCDECNRHSGDYAESQQNLPSPDEMRKRGWHIADVYGDLCPTCLAERG